jgi:hypothetical protein
LKKEAVDLVNSAFDLASFVVRYEWQEGSIPPPYYYEYAIQIGPGLEGRIEFRPDYRFNAPPEWLETFSVSKERIEELHAEMVANRFLDRSWREVITPSIGGPGAQLAVTVGDRTYSFPRQLEPDDARLVRQITEAIHALVPDALWRNLMSQREAYQQSYFRNQSMQGGTP